MKNVGVLFLQAVHTHYIKVLQFTTFFNHQNVKVQLNWHFSVLQTKPEFMKLEEEVRYTRLSCNMIDLL
jgi:hypothetical protein